MRACTNSSGNQTAGREKERAAISIREKWPEDVEAIRFVNEKVFGRPDEAILADALREKQGVLLSLVAAQNDRAAGHILYSRVLIMNAPRMKGVPGLAKYRPEFAGV